MYCLSLTIPLHLKNDYYLYILRLYLHELVTILEPSVLHTSSTVDLPNKYLLPDPYLYFETIPHCENTLCNVGGQFG